MLTSNTFATSRKYFFIADIEEDINDTVELRNAVSTLFHEDTHEFFIDFDIANTTSSLNY